MYTKKRSAMRWEAQEHTDICDSERTQVEEEEGLKLPGNEMQVFLFYDTVASIFYLIE